MNITTKGIKTFPEPISLERQDRKGRISREDGQEGQPRQDSATHRKGKTNKTGPERSEGEILVGQDRKSEQQGNRRHSHHATVRVQKTVHSILNNM
jgi:hypothetical protein